MSRVVPRLKEMAAGGYERGYRHRGHLVKTSSHQFIAELLDSFGVTYKENVQVPGAPSIRADFLVNGTFVLVERTLGKAEIQELKRSGQNFVAVGKEAFRSDRWDHGMRVFGLGESENLQTIFLDDPSFNFDYAHILPKTRKCSVMHGHTSSVLIEVVGHPIDGMVVDFGVAKDLVRSAIRNLDHKLFICERYVTKTSTGSVTLKFKTVHGDFVIRAPRATTVLMPGEATVENLAREVVSRVAPEMPENVTAVGAYVYEGLNKGSYLLAQIHQGGGHQRRKQ